jgi:hypothetical protein
MSGPTHAAQHEPNTAGNQCLWAAVGGSGATTRAGDADSATEAGGAGGASVRRAAVPPKAIPMRCNSG